MHTIITNPAKPDNLDVISRHAETAFPAQREATAAKRRATFCEQASDTVRISRFSTASGCEEIYLSITSAPGLDFNTALERLTLDYTVAVERAGLSCDTAVFSRLFLSDVANQSASVLRSALYNELMHGALSIIEQKPVLSGPVALLSYHIKALSASIRKHKSKQSPDDVQNHLVLQGNHYTLLYTANYTGEDNQDTAGRTTTIFNRIDEVIQQQGMRFCDNAIRTWIFVHDIDNNYRDMVKSRREFFTSRGLTDKTRYLASTGIHGNTFNTKSTVSVDSLSTGGVRPEQIIRMEAPGSLSPTILYGVTFERGLRIRFGDRSHLYISGTASINNKGEVMYPGDIVKQTGRTIDNVCALLSAQNATLGDMGCCIAYVRNAHDAELAGRVIADRLGKTVPLIFAEAPVCRPGWLFEIEGTAIVQDDTPYPAFL